MPEYLESNRYLHLTTPLGIDKLLLTKFTGTEAISELFQFELDMVAENTTDVPFDKLLGQACVFGVAGGEEDRRDFNGIIVGVSEMNRDVTFTRYKAVVVPKLWVLTQKLQSRIFQQKSIPDILKKVFEGLDVAYELQGTFEPREYVTQYHESDFAFASRLMEEEGMYYFFKHKDGHKMVVANTPQSHPDIPGTSSLIFEPVEGGNRPEERVFTWTKQQELRSGKYTLWDHNFELAHKHLETDKTLGDAVQVGKVSHKLKVASNDKWEVYEHPGGYAKRFDGIDKGGGEQAAELQKIFTDNKRTVGIRLEQLENPMLLIMGTGTCRQLTAGHKFTVERHFDADGPYVLTRVFHDGREGDIRSETAKMFKGHYNNSFSAIPFVSTFPFRPQRVTPRPVIAGCQTAVVVGPAGEEIFTDKYGRVKAQFHWDREGKYDGNSSCWMRVGTPWAGKQWGMIHIPRIGQEVIVEFLQGDPDQPIIVGSVYNAGMMPPYDLPGNKTQSGVKTRSTLQGGNANYNEIRFEDKKGSEQVLIHAEKNQDIEVEHDETHWVGNDQSLQVDKNRTKNVKANESILIGGDRTETVSGKETINIKGDRHNKLDGAHNEKIAMDHSQNVGMNIHQKAGMNIAMEAGMQIGLKASLGITLDCSLGITLKAGGSSIDVSPAGVFIKGGPMVFINTGACPVPGPSCSPTAPAAQAAASLTHTVANMVDKGSQEVKQVAAAAAGAAAAASSVVAAVVPAAMSAVSQAAAASVERMAQAGQMAQEAVAPMVAQLTKSVDEAKSDMSKSADKAAGALAEKADQLESEAKGAADKMSEKAKEAGGAAADLAGKAQQEAGKMAQEAGAAAGKAAQEASGAASKAAQEAGGAASKAAQEASAAAGKAGQEASAAAGKAQQEVTQKLNEVKKDVAAEEKKVQEAAAGVQKEAAQAAQSAYKSADEMKQKLEKDTGAITKQAKDAGQMTEHAAQTINQQVSQSAAQAANTVSQTAAAAYSQASDKAGAVPKSVANALSGFGK